MRPSVVGAYVGDLMFIVEQTLEKEIDGNLGTKTGVSIIQEWDFESVDKPEKPVRRLARRLTVAEKMTESVPTSPPSLQAPTKQPLKDILLPIESQEQQPSIRQSPPADLMSVSPPPPAALIVVDSLVSPKDNDETADNTSTLPLATPDELPSTYNQTAPTVVQLTDLSLFLTDRAKKSLSTAFRNIESEIDRLIRGLRELTDAWFDKNSATPCLFVCIFLH